MSDDRDPLPGWTPTLAVAGGVFAVALGLRLWTLSAMEAANPLFAGEFLDERMYLEMARGERDGTPWFVAPLFPALLDLLGVTTRGGAAVVNCVIGALVAAVAAIGGAHQGRSLLGGAIAGGLVAAAGAFVFMDTTVATEPLTALLTLLGVLAIARATSVAGLAPSFAAGLAIGLASLSRGNALAAGLGFAVVLWATRRRTLLRAPGDDSPTDRPWLHKAGAFGGGVALLLLAGSIWSVSTGGSFRPFPWVGGMNLYLGNGPHVRETFRFPDPELGSTPHEQERRGWAGAEEIAGRKLDSAGVASTWAGKALEEMSAAPGTSLVLLAKKAIVAFSRVEIGGNHDAVVERGFAPWTRRVPVTVWWLLALGGAGWLLARRKRRAVDATGLACVGHLLSIALIFPLARYRLPIVPVAAVLAGAGIATLVRRRPDGPTLGKAALVGVGITALAFVPLDLPPRGAAYANMGERLNEQGRPDAALDWYRKAVEDDPTEAVANYRLGIHALNERRNEEALEHLRISAGDPRMELPAMHGLARALSNLGQHVRALEVNAMMLERAPRSADMMAERALLFWMAGLKTEARIALQSAASLDPNSPAVVEARKMIPPEQPPTPPDTE